MAKFKIHLAEVVGLPDCLDGGNSHLASYLDNNYIGNNYNIASLLARLTQLVSD